MRSRYAEFLLPKVIGFPILSRSVHPGVGAEIGHISIDPRGCICGCGRRGCVGSYVSASGLRGTVELLAVRLDESPLRDLIAGKGFEITGAYLGQLLATLAAIFDPKGAVLCGGLVNSADLFIELTQRSFEEHVHDPHGEKARILVSVLNNGQAAVFGASALVHGHVDQVEV